MPFPLDPTTQADQCDDEVLAGRYRLVGLVGHGAVGTVWKAWDGHLGRLVAIKQLHRRDPDGDDLRSEARALARLAHPHVVEVFEVFDHDVRRFVTLEYVEGLPLGDWLTARPAIADLERVFVEVGRGLAAVHAAGMVHGDFKPDNVVVGIDGHAKLVDFGVARDRDAPPPERVAGAPRYRAPECAPGRRPTVAADQYAYCVVALDALRRGAAGWVGSRRARRARRLLRRGLARDPAARWPSMSDLLDAWERGPRRRLRYVAGATMAAAGAVWVATPAAPPEAPCDLSAPAWDDARRRAITTAFARAAPRRGEQLALRVDPVMQRWIAGWEEARDAACARPESSDARRCLARQSERATTLLARLAQDPPRDLVLSAPRAIYGLPEPDACLHAAIASGAGDTTVPPADALDRHLFEAVVLLHAHREAEAIRRLESIVRAAHGREALAIEANLELSQALVRRQRWDEGRDRAEAAYLAATRRGDDDLAARAGMFLTAIHAFTQRELLARRWARTTEALLSAHRTSPAREAYFRASQGYLEHVFGDPAAARRHFERAIELAESAAPDQPELRAAVWSNYATVLAEQGDATAAVPASERALQIQLDAFGPLDRSSARLQGSLALVATLAGELDRALAVSDHALELAEEIDPHDPSLHAPLHLVAARVQLARHDFEVALEHAERAQQAYAQLTGPDSASTAEGHYLIAEALAGLGRIEQSRAQARAAWTRQLALLGADHPTTRASQALLGDATAPGA